MVHKAVDKAVMIVINLFLNIKAQWNQHGLHKYTYMTKNTEQDPKWVNMVMALSKTRVEFNSEIARLMSVPVVYMVLGDDAVLYVGMSQYGVSRLFNRKHHALNHDVWLKVTSIQVFEVDSVSAAKALEANLIKSLKPVHNDRMVGRIRKKTFEIINDSMV